MTHTPDLAAARRQALGPTFTATKQDDRLVAELKEGRLTLNPHPTWNLPAAIDWAADPFEDRNWLHQFPMLRWIDPLRRSAELGDSEAGALWIQVARSWYLANPPHSPAAPLGWKDMVDGIRAIVLSVATPFLADFYPAELSWVTHSISQHVDWLIDERNIGHSNHALNQHMGLFVAASVLRNREAQEIAVARLEQLFSVNYDEEGINAEGALIYHLLNFRWWNEVQRRLEAESFPIPASFAVLSEVPEELAHATKPDGNFVNLGDTDAGRPVGIDNPHTQYVATKGAEGEPPTETIKIYQSGYIFGRSGWGEHERALNEETFFSLSFGRNNKVHGHADGMSLTYSASGVEWLRDPGKYQYGTSAMRRFCLARGSHNLPYVEGANYDESNTIPLVRHAISDSFYSFEFVDNGYQGTTITRRVIYSVNGEYIVVIDNVRSKRQVSVTQNWQLGPNVKAIPGRARVDLTARGQSAALMLMGSSPEIRTATASEDPVSGWVSTGWKQRKAAPTVELRKHGDRFRFVTIIAPSRSEVPPTARRIPGAPDGELHFEVDNGRYQERIAIGPRSVTLLNLDTYEHNADVCNPDDRTWTESTESRRGILDSIENARRNSWITSSPALMETMLGEMPENIARSLLRRPRDYGLRALFSDTAHISPEDYPQGAARGPLVNWHRDPHFLATRDRYPTTSYPEIPASLELDESPELLTFDVGPLVLPALYSPGQGDILTVMFHGALDRTRVQLPVFQRLRFQQSLGVGAILSITDPTLDLSSDLRLGWYLGTDSVDLPMYIARVVRAAQATLHPRRTLLVGGSGGGFAALHVGSFIPEATVVAMNPQTDLSAYSPRFAGAAVSAAFGSSDFSQIVSQSHRTSVTARLATRAAPKRVTIASNPQDKVHARKHIAPLVEYAKRAKIGGIEVVQQDLGPGHRSPTNEQYRELMMPIYEAL